MSKAVREIFMASGNYADAVKQVLKDLLQNIQSIINLADTTFVAKRDVNFENFKQNLLDCKYSGKYTDINNRSNSIANNN